MKWRRSSLATLSLSLFLFRTVYFTYLLAALSCSSLYNGSHYTFYSCTCYGCCCAITDGCHIDTKFSVNERKRGENLRFFISHLLSFLLLARFLLAYFRCYPPFADSATNRQTAKLRKHSNFHIYSKISYNAKIAKTIKKF